MRAKDLSGFRFGSLVVLHRVEAAQAGKARWRCRCDCGGVVDVLAWNLTSGAQHRCSACASQAQAKTITKHGASGSRLYKAWNDMLQRCGNPKLSNYRHYGGKGIRVCSDWHSFEAFQTWAFSAGYADGLTIDRIDSAGNYEPTNCRWLPRNENARLGAVSRWLPRNENARLGAVSRWSKQEMAHA